MIILGIDPGLTGAIAILKNGEPLQIFPMPQDDDGQLHKSDLAIFFRQNYLHITHAYMEMASLRPMQSGQFKIGRNFGVIEGIMVAFGIPYEMILPQLWSKEFPHGVIETDKTKKYKLVKESRANIVRRLYPDIDLRPTKRSLKFHDGMVDALLIANYGWKKHSGK
jgi:hypothetical protein